MHRWTKKKRINIKILQPKRRKTINTITSKTKKKMFRHLLKQREDLTKYKDPIKMISKIKKQTFRHLQRLKENRTK